MSIPPYINVRSTADAARFNDKVEFHDARIKELTFLTHTHFVSPPPGALQSMLCFPYDARMLVHCLWPEPIAVEMVLVSIQALSINGDERMGVLGEVMGGSLEYERLQGWECPQITLSIGRDRFVCLRFLYRCSAEWLGAAPLFSQEIPTQATPVQVLDGGLVMCPNCAHAWEAPRCQPVRCPNCLEVLPPGIEVY
jgi:hypothetical protein